MSSPLNKRQYEIKVSSRVNLVVSLVCLTVLVSAQIFNVCDIREGDEVNTKILVEISGVMWTQLYDVKKLKKLNYSKYLKDRDQLSWDNNIKMSVKEIDYEGSGRIRLVQDKVQ
jgi:hypothetical protein